MKTLYFECLMGASGDMLTSALLELTENPEEALKKLNSLQIPNVEFIKEESKKCGVLGTHIKVNVKGKEEHKHTIEHTHGHSLKNIEDYISTLNISEKVKEDAISVYKIIADAESKVHSVPVNDIHFHEVGTLDAIADVTAVCYLINKIKPDKILASSVNTGSGYVKCAHGVLPVPAPATALILSDIPNYSSGINSELCTPTGAALLKYFCEGFEERPLMKSTKIGYGMGNKDFECANCVRAFLGETKNETSKIFELSFNVDDMTGEEIGFLTDGLLKIGAKEVFSTSVIMKKSRPGILITTLCDEDKRDEILTFIFKNSTTLGVRENIKNRYTLTREIKTIQTPLGEIREKISKGFGTHKSKYEYDDLVKIAKENSLSLKEVKEIADQSK